MRHLLVVCFMLAGAAVFAQSDKDMIIASWKCVSVEQAPITTNKKQKPIQKEGMPNVDTVRGQQVGIVYGFRDNGIVIFNDKGVYEARQYNVEDNVLTLTEHTYVHTVFTILQLNYREMIWQDKYGIIYKFERE